MAWMRRLQRHQWPETSTCGDPDSATFLKTHDLAPKRDSTQRIEKKRGWGIRQRRTRRLILVSTYWIRKLSLIFRVMSPHEISIFRNAEVPPTSLEEGKEGRRIAWGILRSRDLAKWELFWSVGIQAFLQSNCLLLSSPWNAFTSIEKKSRRRSWGMFSSRTRLTAGFLSSDWFSWRSEL